jgi:signal transduction histidine kinase
MIRRVLARPAIATLLLWLALVVPIALGFSTLKADITEQLPALVLAMGVVITARRVPVIALGAAVALSLTATFTQDGLWVAGVMVIGSYLVGRHSDVGRVAVVAFIGAGVIGIGLSGLGGAIGPAITALIIEVVFNVLPWWTGTYLRQRSELVEAGWTRAELLESRQEFVAEQARLRERAEIAREMHDSLGHELSLLALSAGALEVTDLTLEQRRQVVRMREAAVRSMDELHEIVSVLREDRRAGAVHSDGRSIGSLVERARATGTHVEFKATGDQDSWPAAASRAVYRIVQEILTNAAKHAGAAPVELSIDSDDSTVHIHASNQVDGAADQRSDGSGLPGMRERARLLGGRLQAERVGGSFIVDASIPMNVQPGAAAVSAPAQRSVSADRRTHRRRAWLVAVVPITMVLVAACALLATNAVTTMRNGMDPSTFDQLQIGQQHSNLLDVLPMSHISQAPPVFVEPARPPGSSCEYFRTTTNPFVVGADELYRLCFADGTLVSKDVIS